MFFDKYLTENEELIAVLRKSKISWLPRYFLSFVLFFIPFFLLVPLFNWGVWGKVVFCFLLALAVYYLIKLINLSYFNSLVVTDKRLMNFRQRKFFERKMVEIDLVDITAVTVHIKGLLHKISNSGNLKISWQVVGSNKEKKIIVRNIKQAEKVQRLLLDLKKHLFEQDKHNSQPQKSYQQLLIEIKDEIGYATLLKLVKSLKETADTEDEELEEEEVELVENVDQKM